MSKSIDLNKPLSDEDRAYLASRARHHEIIVNDRMFGPNGTGPEPEFVAEEDVEILDIDPDIAEHVLSLDEKGLSSELIKTTLLLLDTKKIYKALAIYLQLNRNEEEHEKAVAAKKAEKAAKRA